MIHRGHLNVNDTQLCSDRNHFTYFPNDFTTSVGLWTQNEIKNEWTDTHFLTTTRTVASTQRANCPLAELNWVFLFILMCKTFSICFFCVIRNSWCTCTIKNGYILEQQILIFLEKQNTFLAPSALKTFSNSQWIFSRVRSIQILSFRPINNEYAHLSLYAPSCISIQPAFMCQLRFAFDLFSFECKNQAKFLCTLFIGEVFQLHLQSIYRIIIKSKNWCSISNFSCSKIVWCNQIFKFEIASFSNRKDSNSLIICNVQPLLGSLRNWHSLKKRNSAIKCKFYRSSIIWMSFH